MIAFACEAAAAYHPDRLRNALFEGFYDGAFFLVLVVLYGISRNGEFPSRTQEYCMHS